MLRTQPVTDNINTPYPLRESTRSAVSWGAVIAGAVIGAALTITLITGGSGLGFLSVSPWQNDGISGTSLAIGTIVWLLVTQIIAYGISGYVTGRLRTKWTDVQRDEVYFRDTAHGFLVWALSSIVGFVLLGSIAASMVSGTAQAGASIGAASAGAASATAGSALLNSDEGFSLDYYTDTMLRSNKLNQTDRQQVNRKEVSTILTRSLVRGELAAKDKEYLISVIAQRAEISEAEARARLQEVTDEAKQAFDKFETQARETADEARKAAAIFALWAFASLLLGAFVASFSATIGGRARDL